MKHLIDNKTLLDVLDEVFASTAATAIDSGAVALQGEDATQPYMLSRTSGDFCCGWVEGFQALHSDMSDAQPLKGAPPPTEGPDGAPIYGWFNSTPCDAPLPIHDRFRPPAISVNFAVQPLTRWNGPMRIIPWGDMEAFADGGVGEPPGLEEELRDRPDWLASRIFPLDAGDALLRDLRVWHGGCPNLSGESRYLPSMEVVSAEYYEWFCRMDAKEQLESSQAAGADWWLALPAQFAAEIRDPRARRRCRDFVDHEPSSEVNRRAGDLDWLRWHVARPNRPKTLPAAELGVMEVELAGLLAALERLSANAAVSGDGPWSAHGERKLHDRLQALINGSLRPKWLFEGASDGEEKCIKAAAVLRRALLANGTIAIHDAAVDLTRELEELIAKALSSAGGADVESRQAKRHRHSSPAPE